MKKIVCALLVISLCGIAIAEEGRILKNGPIAIQLNAKPCIALMGRSKSASNFKVSKDSLLLGQDRMEFTDEQIAFLANNVPTMRGITFEQAKRIKEINPDFKYLTYTSSTFLKHWTSEEVERDYMHHLAMTPAAVLDRDISRTTTEFTVSPYIWPDNEITKFYVEKVRVDFEAVKKENPSVNSLNDLIPIYASVVKGELSKHAREFLFFVRIGDELMRVDEWDVNLAKIKVTRGFNGSTARSHKKAAVLTSPVYCLTGHPISRNRLKLLPEKKTGNIEYKKQKPSPRLDYCSDKGAANIPILERRAKEILDIMNEGYDGSALDAMSAKLPAHRMVNALGGKTVPWNFAKNEPYSVKDWVGGHDRMIGVIHRYVYEHLGHYPVLVANGVARDNFAEGDGDGGFCKRLLIPTEVKSRPMSAYNTEVGLKTSGSAFPGQLKMYQIAFQENLAVRGGGITSPKSTNQEHYDKMINYGAAFLYLAYEPKPDDWNIDRDGFGVMGGGQCVSPYLHLPSIGPEWKPAQSVSFKVGYPYTIYLPLGKPLESPTPGDLDALRYKNTNVFMRRYENGLVLINPTFSKTMSGEYDPGRIDIDLLDSDEKTDLSMPRTYTVTLDRRYIDPLIGDYIEGKITMEPYSGKVLLINPSL